MGGCELDLSVSEYGPIAACCQCDNELSDFIKCGVLLTSLAANGFSSGTLLQGVRELERTFLIYWLLIN